MKAIGNDPESSRPTLIDEAGAGERARSDKTMNIARARGASHKLKKTGRLAVVAAEPRSIAPFKKGIEELYGNDRKGNPRTLWLPASATIQNDTFEANQGVLKTISDLRRSLGFVVLGFEGVDYSKSASEDAWRLTQRVESIMDKQDAREQEDKDRRLKLGKWASHYTDKYRRDFGVLLVGTGAAADLPGHPDFSPPEGFLSKFTMRLALLESGELADRFQPAPGIYRGTPPDIEFIESSTEGAA